MTVQSYLNNEITSKSVSDDTILRLDNITKLFGLNKSAAKIMIENEDDKNEILRKTGVTVAVNDVSFDLKKGEVFVIIGLSGSGKSTVLRCINLLQRPTSGNIYLNNNNIMQMKKKDILEMRRTQMSMVFQNFALMSHMNVLKNVAYGLKIRGVSKEVRENKAEEIINLVGLKGWENKNIGDLSGGMRQRVGIARAMCNDPQILLMDEPFSALDPIARHGMQFELLSLQERFHKSIIFITHDVNEAFKLGDRVGVMRDGKMEQYGTPEDLLLNPVNDFVRNFLNSVDKTKLLNVEHIMITPSCLIREYADPVIALNEMREHEVSSAYVIDREMKFRGVITLNNAIEAKQEKERTVLSFIIRDVPCVRKDESLSSILNLASSTPFPLPVVDEKGRLEGIISRAAILSMIC